MSGILSLTGVVVRLHDYRETDRIVELLTVDEGRVALIARGARVSRKRFVGALDLFVSLQVEAVTVTRGRKRDNLWTLKSARILDPRLGIRSSLKAVWRASALVESACLLSPERQEASAMSEALLAGLDSLASGDPVAAARVFPLLLKAAGLLPDDLVCSRCGIETRSIAELSRIDEVLCTTCAPDRRPLDPNVRAALSGAPCANETVATELENCVIGLIEAHVGRRLRSRALGS